MAHDEATRRAARSAYAYDQLPLERAAAKAGVPASTLARWKREAKAEGDDWDKVRAANALASGGVEDVARQMLTDYVVQHKTLIDHLRDETTGERMSPRDKADILASLADSFNKTVAACRRVMPETNELAVALEVLGLLGDYVREHFPGHAPALLEVLEPFGYELSKHYGGKA
ncbi:DUF1804 family protein [Nitratidesulfovibrio vulgaris]|uniref:Uncharacterized protein n=1 Tax=Nitratidesulfovibrio vulgaris (strain ATCC 29579 / DSM 644 / CCUG 34227 / NCIMB 8303 / VKM B-1760 / Hildenborough) TaxID=882 RepID=Q728A0_NITV2|nr:DUF1804 family protein [Nitratidesulfovibrio vulgaris]AAS97176.1 conserved hypothetical protein [Nitratidesulfovibrio vulgaris str. Hildenborough]ADP87642.1 protein of unknown function DUF1804 [Nitratidesulfovibrio vulgaris RCH1]HBW16178.1 DUF1804 domain-containing protein [Desulfovibrio sp.]